MNPKFLPVLFCTALLGACATMQGADAPPVDVSNAQAVTKTADNGDVVTEYRVAGQVRMVKVQPPRGPAYYLYDHGNGKIEGDDHKQPPQTYWKLFSW